MGRAYELATGQRLGSGDFEGGKSGAVAVLRKLGFTVQDKQSPASSAIPLLCWPGEQLDPQVPLLQGAEEGLFGRVAGSGDGRRRFGGRVLGACWLLRVALADVSGWVYAVWVSRAAMRMML